MIASQPKEASPEMWRRTMFKEILIASICFHCCQGCFFASDDLIMASIGVLKVVTLSVSLRR